MQPLKDEWVEVDKNFPLQASLGFGLRSAAQIKRDVLYLFLSTRGDLSPTSKNGDICTKWSNSICICILFLPFALLREKKKCQFDFDPHEEEKGL